MLPLLMLINTAAAQEASGYLENLVQVPAGVSGAPLTVVERARPSFSAELGDRAALVTTVDVAFVQGRTTTTELERLVDEAGLSPTFQAAGQSWPSYQNEVLRIDRFQDAAIVDRLYLDLYRPKVDIRIGRQALNWGSAFMVNPTDPFPQVILTEPWRNRTGVNAARFTVPFGDWNQSALVIATSDVFDQLRVVNRTTFVVGSVDLSVLGAWNQAFEEQGALIEQASPLLGVDVRGTLGVGYWVEAAAHFEGLGQDPGVYEEIAVGVDYSFPVLQSLMVTAQYYRSGRETSDLDPLAQLSGTATASNDPFAPFFSGENYLMAAVNVGVTEHLSAGVLHVQNLDDGSALMVPTLGTTLGDRWSVTLAGQIPLSTWGDGGELNTAEQDLRIALPTTDGDMATLDLNDLVPDATFTLQTRFSF
ncbi:MAG: hypothetical protein ACI9VR_003011 [Cognaticolwellia sp.]|jgi:hypothetical protein